MIDQAVVEADENDLKMGPLQPNTGAEEVETEEGEANERRRGGRLCKSTEYVPPNQVWTSAAAKR